MLLIRDERVQILFKTHSNEPARKLSLYRANNKHSEHSLSPEDVRVHETRWVGPVHANVTPPSPRVGSAASEISLLHLYKLSMWIGYFMYYWLYFNKILHYIFFLCRLYGVSFICREMITGT